jgi:type IV pilus assembly protein PilB
MQESVSRSVGSAVAERPSSSLTGVARVLVHAGLISNDRAVALAQRAQERRVSFIAAVREHGVLSASQIAHALSRSLSLPLVDLDAIDAQRLPRNLLDSKTEARFEVVALGKRGSRVFVGAADPTSKEADEQIKFITQLQPTWVLVEQDKLLRLLVDASTRVPDVSDVGNLEGLDLEMEVEPEDGKDTAAETSEVEDAPVVRFLQKMLADAIALRASDLHFEPYEHNYRVRFRIDGELREVSQPPPAIKERLAARIKVISRLDISEKRVPQDGRVKLKFHGQSIDFRVSTLPTLYGEKIVIRILDSSTAKLGIDVLGYEPVEKSRLLDAISRPYGMILVTGPTGSGKTVSLYACLNMLNKPGVNISTVEDPAEINMPGVNQVNVNDRAGLTFAAALKSFLRQDPDIIMVGEIRDLETAEIAIKASQTGHLVLSTLHTNDAPSTLTRLLNMGVAPFNIASSVLLITAQRLARKLCESCKAPAEYPRASLLAAGFADSELDGSWKPYKAVGCSQCNQGYKGRTGVYQVMPISETIQRIILNQGSSLDLAAQSRIEGVLTLREAGLVKVRRGVTSLEEVLSATNQ